jgi:hypothetical protein|tara:strand:- start:443 stop:685 length:243 start_codon:yes stop_codon:yes gene_type:complete
MKVLFLFAIITAVLGTKFIVSNQLNQIKKIEKELFKIDDEIERLKTDYSYLTSPKNLKKINKDNLELSPIEQKDIIKLED